MFHHFQQKTMDEEKGNAFMWLLPAVRTEERGLHLESLTTLYNVENFPLMSKTMRHKELQKVKKTVAVSQNTLKLSF